MSMVAAFVDITSRSAEGEAIQAAAYQLGPLTPGGVGPAVQGVAVMMGVLSLVVVSLRVWVRAGYSGASTRLLGPEDYLAILGTLPFIPAVVFAVLAAQYGVGSHDSDLPSTLYLIRAAEYEVYWELLYFLSSTMIKCAIGFTCIRLDRRKRILVPIIVNMSIMVIIAVLAIIFVFVNCEPFPATWNPYLGTCQTVLSLTTVSYIVSAIQMATDWACAIIPFFIVAGLQMSRRKKVSVILILGLGVFASIATCVRMPYLKYYDTATYPTETMYHFGIIQICSNIECGLGIIGCSLPPLRKLFNFYYGSTSEGKYANTGNSEGLFASSGNGIKLNSFKGSLGRQNRAIARRDYEIDDTFDDGSSNTGIIRKTEVTVTVDVYRK